MKKPITLLVWFGILLLIMITGVVGFMLTDHYSFLDALYMSVIEQDLALLGYLKNVSRQLKPNIF